MLIYSPANTRETLLQDELFKLASLLTDFKRNSNSAPNPFASSLFNSIKTLMLTIQDKWAKLTENKRIEPKLIELARENKLLMQKLSEKSNEIDKSKTGVGDIIFSNEKMKVNQDYKEKSNEKSRLASSQISFKDKSNEKEKDRMPPSKIGKLKPNPSLPNQSNQFTSNLIEKLIVLTVNLQTKLFSIEAGGSSPPPLPLPLPLPPPSAPPPSETLNILRYQEKIIKNEAELDLAKKSLIMYIDYIKEIEERKDSWVSEDGQVRIELEKLKNENNYLMEVNKRLEEEILIKMEKFERSETPQKLSNEETQLFPIAKPTNENNINIDKSNEDSQILLDSSFPAETNKKRKEPEINRKSQNHLTPSDFNKNQQVRKSERCDRTPENLARKSTKPTNDFSSQKRYDGLIESVIGLNRTLQEFLSQNKGFSLENECMERVRREKRSLEEKYEEILKVERFIFKNTIYIYKPKMYYIIKF